MQAGWPLRVRKVSRLAGRGIVLVAIPLGLVVLAVAGSLATYRAVQAAQGHGTKGYFVDVRGASGRFQLPDGQVRRQQVVFADPPPGLAPGAVIPALDTGDASYVFPRHGSRHWVTDASILAAVAAGIAAWAWFVPWRLSRRRRGKLAAPGASGSAAGAALGRPTVLAAASDPTWATVTIALLNGDVSTRRVNAALRKTADRADYPLEIMVAIPLTEFDRTSYPVSGESTRLAELTATVTRLVGANGVLAATLADSTAWVFLIYTGDTGWLATFEDEVRSAVPDHLVRFRAGRDPRWRAYRDLSRLLPRRVRDRVVLLVVVPVIFAVPAARYGIAWAAATLVAVAAWAVTVAFAPRERMLAAQLAHPATTFAVLCGILATVFFPLGAIIVHPASPWLCLAGAAVLAIAVPAALWPAQLKFYARMRARAALQLPGLDHGQSG